MKYNTAAQWAQTRDMSMGDIEECLMELGYQTLDIHNQLRWRLTEKGRAHAKKSLDIFNRSIRWDFDAFFDVVKHYGRKKRVYFYCSNCGGYMNAQSGFDTNMDKWVCKECGCVNDLAYEVQCANELAAKYKDVLRGSKPEAEQMEKSDVHWKCPECGREAFDIDEINVIFGFAQTSEGKLIPQKECKACRGKS